MIKKLFVFPIIGVIFLWSCNDTGKQSIDKDSAEALLEFIPPNYEISDTTRGDINKDGILDLIMVLNPLNDTSANNIENDKRLMIILTTEKNNTYKLAQINENIIDCVKCGGVFKDPYQNIEIKDNVFTVIHYGGNEEIRWGRFTGFEFDNKSKNWYLKEDALLRSPVSNPDEVEPLIKTQADFGEIKFEDFNIKNKLEE